MKCVINDQVVLSRALEGPLAAHIGAFAESRSALGYARCSMQREVRLAAGFSRWLKQKGIALRRVGADHASRYLRDRAREVRANLGDAVGLRHLLDFLRGEGVIAAERIRARRLSPAERCAQDTRGTCTRHAHWPDRRSSTMCRSFVGFSRIASVADP